MQRPCPNGRVFLRSEERDKNQEVKNQEVKNQESRSQELRKNTYKMYK
jgi:hypothetical protein